MPARTKRSGSAKKRWQQASSERVPLVRSNRPAKLKQWNNSSMLQAMEAVRLGTMGVNEAARAHGIPPTTLKNRLSGRVKHGTLSGPEPYLTAAEETELSDFLVQSSKIGYGKTKREVFSIVEQTLKKKFNGEGWWHRFVERHPELSLRTSDPLSRVRANAITKENM